MAAMGQAKRGDDGVGKWSVVTPVESPCVCVTVGSPCVCVTVGVTTDGGKSVAMRQAAITESIERLGDALRVIFFLYCEGDFAEKGGGIAWLAW
jgi:hypothetical protein